MTELNTKIKELFANGEIELFIGYETGTRLPRPLFASSAEDSEKLIFDDKCTGNLAVYLTRKDLIENKKTGIAASYYTLKSIVQLYAENQIKENIVKIISLSEDGKLIEFTSAEAIKEYLQTATPPSKEKDDELIAKLNAMSVQERWEYWTNELSKCFKCYACRSACPMCYCNRCVVEVNRPQWIQPWAATLSNMEWQINRVMHMAGRCSDCGSCSTACPLGLPIHLLTHKMAQLVKENFGNEDNNGNVLSTFKPDDKETFIL